LPEYGQSGGQWRDHPTIINGILWKLRTGSPWRDLPERYGPWQTCFDRFNRWRRDGTWDRLLSHAQTKNDAVGEVQWELSVDDTVVRAHQHAAGARREPAKNENARGGLMNAEGEALGRSRGGFSTKVHLACDGKGRPLSETLPPQKGRERLLDGCNSFPRTLSYVSGEPHCDSLEDRTRALPHLVGRMLQRRGGRLHQLLKR
jgi:transposase